VWEAFQFENALRVVRQRHHRDLRIGPPLGQIVQPSGVQSRAGAGQSQALPGPLIEPLELGLEPLDFAPGPIKLITVWLLTGIISLAAWYGLIRLGIWIGSKIVQQ
jgi:hypothetical protein